jgi:hypothetical protein
MNNETSKPFPPASPAAGQSPVEPLTGGAACLFVVELAMVGAVAYGVLSAALRLL